MKDHNNIPGLYAATLIILSSVAIVGIVLFFETARNILEASMSTSSNAKDFSQGFWGRGIFTIVSAIIAFAGLAIAQFWADSRQKKLLLGQIELQNNSLKHELEKEGALEKNRVLLELRSTVAEAITALLSVVTNRKICEFRIDEQNHIINSHHEGQTINITNLEVATHTLKGVLDRDIELVFEFEKMKHNMASIFLMNEQKIQLHFDDFLDDWMNLGHRNPADRQSPKLAELEDFQNQLLNFDRECTEFFNRVRLTHCPNINMFVGKYN